MKKFLLLFILFISFTLTSCNNEKYDIVTTNYVGYDAARAITNGTNKKIKLITSGDAHNFDASAKDIADVINCNLFIYVGGESDVEVVKNKILINVKDNVKIVNMFDVLKNNLYPEEEDEDASIDEQESIEDIEYDEHVWLDPSNYKMVVGAVADALIDIDKDNKEIYEKNNLNYQNEITNVDNKCREMLSNYNNKVIIIADRNPFLYFKNYYDIDIIGLYPGCGSLESLGASKKAAIIDSIKLNRSKYIFKLENTDDKNNSAINIKNEINNMVNNKSYDGPTIDVLSLYSMENPSKDDITNNITYIDMFNHNIDVIEKSLK